MSQEKKPQNLNELANSLLENVERYKIQMRFSHPCSALFVTFGLCIRP